MSNIQTKFVGSESAFVPPKDGVIAFDIIDIDVKAITINHSRTKLNYVVFDNKFMLSESTLRYLLSQFKE